MVDNNLVCTGKHAELAMPLLIAVFYIFRIEYSAWVVSVMEFMQR